MMAIKSSYRWIVVFLFLTLGLCACEHRVLEDIEYSHYVRVYIDDQIQNVTYGLYNDKYYRPRLEIPNTMQVLLCNPTTGNVEVERYLQNCGEDERGMYIDGYVSAPPGNYHMLIYNFNSEYTRFRNDRNFQQIEAYTNPISTRFHLMDDVNANQVCYAPDHLYTVVDVDTKISLNNKVDTLLNAQGDFFTASSLVKSYYLQIRIRGVQWIKVVNSTISGMSPSVRLSDGKTENSKSSLLSLDIRCAIEESKILDEASVSEEGQEAVLYTTFNTFGIIPHTETDHLLTLEFIKTDGKLQIETIDISSLLNTRETLEHRWLLLDHEIVITPSEDVAPDKHTGGFEPSVDDWKDVIIDIII